MSAARARVATVARDPANTISSEDVHRGRWGQREPAPSAAAAQGAALRSIDVATHGEILRAADADRLDQLVRGDVQGYDSEYIAAISDELYERAFAQTLLHGANAALRMDPAEAEAMRRVLRASEMRETFQAAGPITIGGGALPVPLSVDPSIQLTSAGSLSPIRTKANVVQISTQQYKLGTSASMTAHFVAEGTEVSDDTPTVSPATITPQRAQAFADFSIEAQQDWAGVSANLMTMLADAKNTIEGTMFLTGAGEGSNQPQGLLVGSTVIYTTASTVLGVSDLTGAQAALQPRYQAGSEWYGNIDTYNRLKQLVPAASTTAAPIWDSQGNLLRRPFNETSDMASYAATAKFLVLGDIRQGYRIVDRIGLSVEIVPHILGSNRRPLGVRGLFAYWRCSALVVNPAAVKVVQVHA